MGINITNCCKLFHCGVKREQYDNFIGFREFLERITMYFFSNTFTIDTGVMAKNIPCLDHIYNKGNLPTCRGLYYSSSSPRNSGISTILEITVITDVTTTIGHTASKEFERDGGGGCIIGWLGVTAILLVE